MNSEFLQSDTGGLVLQIIGAVVSAAFVALTGSKLYTDRTNRVQRVMVNLFANAVSHTYSNYVRPLKDAAQSGKLTPREKATAEDTAVRYVYDSAKAKGITIPIEKREEIRAEIVKEVAKVKAAARTSPSTKGA